MNSPGLKFNKNHLEIVLKIEKKTWIKKKRLVLLLGITFFALIAGYFLFKSPSLDQSFLDQQISPIKTTEVSTAPIFKEHSLVIPPGKSIADLLSPFLPYQLIHELILTSFPVYNLNRIKAGHNLVIKTLESGEFHSLTYEIDKSQYLEIKRENNSYSASLQNIPLERRLCYLSGEIKESLIESLNQLGERDYLALSLAEIFAWEIDFYLDLRAGDTFSLVFEKNYRNNEFIGYGDILAAQIINQGKKYQAFRFLNPETGKADYFDAEGKSLKKDFLRSPIKYARITSRFSQRRLHPIHKIFRPHYGIDYAAPIGTPVQATADGIVTFAGWNGTSGRMIRLRHKNGYETLYLHLQNFSPEIKAGAQVKAGDIIGYVGSSGESTGPHLDYRILYHGRYINPLAWRFEPANPLPSELLENFKNEIKVYVLLLSDPLWLAQQLVF